MSFFVFLLVLLTCCFSVTFRTYVVTIELDATPGSTSTNEFWAQIAGSSEVTEIVSIGSPFTTNVAQVFHLLLTDVGNPIQLKLYTSDTDTIIFDRFDVDGQVMSCSLTCEVDAPNSNGCATLTIDFQQQLEDLLRDSHPCNIPSMNPSQSTTNPSETPTIYPTNLPTTHPSSNPSSNPSLTPTIAPTNHPSINPTLIPTVNPSKTPTNQPSIVQTDHPSFNPSTTPTIQPSFQPTSLPSINPSETPTIYPTKYPTSLPTFHPSQIPTNQPSFNPSVSPSNEPSENPSKEPSKSPIFTNNPSNIPTINPTNYPSSQPTINQLTDSPTNTPTKSDGKTSNKSKKSGSSDEIIYAAVLVPVLCILLGIFYFYKFKHKKSTTYNQNKNNIIKTMSTTDNQKQTGETKGKINLVAINSMSNMSTPNGSEIDTNNINTGEIDEMIDDNINTPFGMGELANRLETKGRTTDSEQNEQIKEGNENNNENLVDIKQEEKKYKDTMKRKQGEFGNELKNVKLGEDLILDDIVDDMENEQNGCGDNITQGYQTKR